MPDALGRDVIAGLSALNGDLAAALQDLAALGIPEVMREVPLAVVEVDAAMQHTADAAGTIMDACEALEAALADTACSGTASATAARIYEACAFQDIVGQRLAKVVRTLHALESRSAALARVFGPAVGDPAGKATLLSGPQSRPAAMEQRAVDALMAAGR